MKNIYFVISVLTIFMASVCLAEISKEIGMVTGSSKGTYIQFGKQIAEVAKKEGVFINIKTSDGSMDNIIRMKSKENAGLGIVQSDVLAYIQKSKDDPHRLKSYIKYLRLIYPLYNEEVHLFAQKHIKSIYDLNQKKVYIGKTGSGNFLTARNLLTTFNVKPETYITDLTPEDSIIAVITGDIDAMFYVAGKPTRHFEILSRLKQDPQISPHFEKTHFVPIDRTSALGDYVSSSIGPEDYKWLDQTVQTIAVKAVLITYNWTRKPSEYFNLRCKQIGHIAKAIRDNFDYLKQKGHPKWKQVNLDEKLGIWQVDQCSGNRPDEAPPASQSQMDLDRVIRCTLSPDSPDCNKR